MTASTVPFLMPKWQGGSFNIVRVPLWDREWIADVGDDSVYASFIARPDVADTAIKFEIYDGEEYIVAGIVSARAGTLITANDTGFNSISTIVRAHWKTLYNTLYNSP